ncbi:MAG TPA: hypothetical protein VEW25_13005 [Allosphingosinicella sp.]|nr:hypothetical protein [Allosphingosinicella sp.]
MADTAPGASGNPSTAEVLEALSDGPAPDVSLPPQLIESDIDRQRSYAHLVGLQQHYSHKSQWSYFLMAMMLGMIGFQSFLLFKVGAAQWTFAEYDWLLPALLVQNLAQIAGLCVIVVQALFKDVQS